MGEQGDGIMPPVVEDEAKVGEEHKAASPPTPEQQGMNEAADLLIDVVRRCDVAGETESCLHNDDKEKVFRFAKGLQDVVSGNTFTIETARQQMNRILEAVNHRAQSLRRYNNGELPGEVRRQMLMVGDAAKKLGLAPSR